MSSVAQLAVEQFRTRIDHALFPCVGAKSALATDNMRFLLAGDLRQSSHDGAVVAQLQAFAATMPGDALFISQVVLFPETPALDELRFEQALWQRLQALHEVDAAEYAWDASVSDDPQSAQFSLSLGGRGYYVIGLHPGASRPARRFDCAALVFNLHSQFETLRADGRYDKLRAAITERDTAYSGSPNPMLATHGEASEAPQYSGRQVDAAWRCPFSAAARERVDGA